MFMRPAIINRYVFWEVSGSFIYCFGIFLLAGLIAGFLPLLQKGMEAGLGLTLILFQMLMNALPNTLVTVLPLSITIGILLGLGRMSVDNEIAAAKSAGIPVVRLLPPVLLLGMLGFLLSLACTLWLIPRGIGEGRRLLHQALTTRVDAGLDERTFFDTFKNLILYVEKIEPATGVITNLFIRESSQPDEVKTIMAKKGKVVPDPEGKALILHLRDGTIISEDRNGDSAGALVFESQIFRYPIHEAAMETSVERWEELSIGQIRRRIREAQEQEKVTTGFEKDFNARRVRHGRVLIAQRIAYPLACLALALTAFPLGVLSMGNSRLNNVAIGMVVIFAYYAVTLAADRVARSGLAPPEPSFCAPALLFFAVAAYLIHCVQMERTPVFVTWARKAIRALGRDRV